MDTFVPAETVISFSPSSDSAWTDIGEINAQRIAPKATQGLIPNRFAGRILSPSLRIPMGSIPTDRLLDIIVPPREGVPEKKEKKSPHGLAKPLGAVKAVKRSETPSAGIVARTLSTYKPFPLLSRIIGGSGPALDTLIQ